VIGEEAIQAGLSLFDPALITCSPPEKPGATILKMNASGPAINYY
jgi:hypothetical protein